MGKVFLRVKTNNNDGIPTDAVAFVKGSGTANHGSVDDAKNPRIKKIIGTVNHNGGSGFTAEAIIILNDGSDSVGKIDTVRVLTRGSGYTTPPTVTFGDSAEGGFTVVLGTGEPTRESILIAQDGHRKNTEGQSLFLTQTGGVPEATADGKPGTGSTIPDFAGFFKSGGVKASEFPIFNPYQKHIDYKDLTGFGKNAITTAGMFASLSSISEMRTQVAETNKKIIASNKSAIAFNVELTKGYESDRIAAEEKIRQAFEDDLAAFQEGTGKDVLQFSHNLEGTAAVDPVWHSISTTISNLLPFFQAIARATGDPIPGVATNFARNSDAIAFYNSLDSTQSSEAFFPSMGTPRYPSKPNFRNENQSQVSLPSSVGVAETVAKGFILKALCFAGFAALGHLYELLSKNNSSSSFSSVIKVYHSPNCFAPKDTDGVFVEWFKTSCRQHDIIGNLHTMVVGVYAVYSSIAGLLTGSNKVWKTEEARKVQAMMAAAAASSMVESLKSTYSLLTEWVETCSGHEKWNSSGEEGFTYDQKAYIQRLDVVRGCIAVKLDEIAYYYLNGYTDETRGAGKFQVLMTAYGGSGYMGHMNTNGASSGSFDPQKSLYKKENIAAKNAGFGQLDKAELYSTSPLEVQIYGNKTALVPAQVVVFFLKGELTDIEIPRSPPIDEVVQPRKEGKGFIFAPVVRINPWVLMPKADKVSWIVVDAHHTKRGYSEKALDISKKGLAREAKNEINVEIMEGDGAAVLSKYEGILEDLKGYISDVLPTLLTGSLLKKGKKGQEYSLSKNDVNGRNLNTVRYGFGFELGEKHVDMITVPWRPGMVNLKDLRVNILLKVYDSNIEAALEKKLCALDFFSFDMGKCDETMLDSMNDDLANTFFQDPTAYMNATIKQRVNESICQKKACGVVHAYSEAPAIQMPNDETPICGNSTIVYNMHPTAEWWFNRDGGDASIMQRLLGQNNINGDLRISDLKGHLDWPMGNLGDSSVPPVFGNWTVILGNDKDERSTLGKGFSFIWGGATQLATFGQARKVHLFNPVINVPFRNQLLVAGGAARRAVIAENLLVTYNAKRLYYPEEFMKKTGSGSDTTKGQVDDDTAHGEIAKRKTSLDAGEYWSSNSSKKFIDEHQESLKKAYGMVVAAGGKNAWDNDIAGAYKVEPILSKTQTFSGMCYPHITQYDVGKEAYLIGALPNGAYESLGEWHPTANAWQDQQEISIGRETSNALDQSSEGSYLSKGQILKSKHSTNEAADKTVTDTRGSTLAGYGSNKEVYMSKHTEWKSLVDKLYTRVEAESKKWPLVHIEDISYHFKIKASGLKAGSDNFYQNDTEVLGMTEASIAKTTMNVQGYVAEATEAYNNGGIWVNTYADGRKEPFDSDNLKAKHRIPYLKDKKTIGPTSSSMISGALKNNKADAYASAEDQYENYTGYVNMFHYTGVATYKDGVRHITEIETLGTYKKPWEKTGYHATNGDTSKQNAWNLLKDVEAVAPHPAAGTSWATALASLAAAPDSQPLAVSGVKIGPRDINVTYDHDYNVWSPIEPATLEGPSSHNLVANNIGQAKGASLSAANIALVAFKEAAKRGGGKRNGGGCTWPGVGLASFSGSITGRGSSKTIALTAAMNALGTYSSGQYGAYGSGLNVDRISPVNTSGAGHLNFFTTGATTWNDGASVTKTGITPLALFDPSDAYETSPTKQAWASRFLYKSALTHLGSSDICLALDTATNCNFTSGVSNMTLHNDCDNTPQVGCDIGIIDSPGSNSNWLIAMSGVRRLTYETIRERLGLQHHNVDNNFTDGQCHASSTGTYSTGDFAADDVVVFPNTGALVHVEANQSEMYWNLSGKIASSNAPSWSTNGVRSVTQANNAITGDIYGVGAGEVDVKDAYQIVNLKNWASDGDLDIYVAEDISMWGKTIVSGDCTSATPSDWKRALMHYRYRTAVFHPLDASNISGAIQVGAYTTVSGLGTTTTPLIKPFVYVGEGSCPRYDNEVKQTIVTGRIDEKKSQCFIPLAKNKYEGLIIASGYVPVVTGICDWSANKRQIYYPQGRENDAEAYTQSAGWGDELQKPLMSGTEPADESYLVNYPKGTSGLMTPKGESSEEENKTAREATKVTKTTFDNSLNIPIHKLLALSGVSSLITKPHKSDTNYNPVFLGGWPVRNQTHEDASEAFNPKTIFGKKYIVLSPDAFSANTKVGKQIKRNEYKIMRKIIFGAQSKLTQRGAGASFGISDNLEDFQEAIAALQAMPSMASMKRSIYSVKWEAHDLVALKDGKQQGGSLISSKKGAGYMFGFDQDIVDGAHTSEIYNYIVVEFEVQAAACDQCLPSAATIDNVGHEVVFFGENYRHTVQVDWELRSGGWHFKVPYVEPGMKLNQDAGTLVGEQEITTRNWWDYISNDFMNSSIEGKTPLYTGHHTSWGMPFKGEPTQLNCSADNDQISTYDKIFDFHLNFNPETSNYKQLKKSGPAQGNEINFKKPQ
jgi:hypothetical protein